MLLRSRPMNKKPVPAARSLPEQKLEGAIGGPAFHADDLRRRTGDDVAMMTFILRACIEDFPEHVNTLRTALSQDPIAAAQTAHTIKGAAGNASFLALAELARTLEGALSAQQPATVEHLAQQLPSLLDRSVAEAERFLATLECG